MFTGRTPTVTPTPTATPTPSSIFNMVIVQDGPNVVMSGTGTINLTDLTPRPFIDFPNTYMWPLQSRFSPGPTPSWGGNYYTGTTFTMAPSFGSSFLLNASSGSGSGVGVVYNPYIGSESLIIDSSYVSGAPITTYSTFNNTTLNSLGLISGTYTYSWGTGPNYGVIILQI